ncbi:MAG: hypothetical protein QOG13_2357 [Sphingomonadales bacterium]|jgi:hypothetical protein|nr:hypothetical protein [Sphingomonadales bacterium]MEA3043214.1 hypothetical protein [Sphingomonadales bacterium]
MIGSRAAILSLLLAVAPAAAQDIPALSLAPGEAVAVQFDDGGRTGPPVRSQAAWTRFDLLAARQLAGMIPPDAPVPEATPVGDLDGTRPPPIPPNEVRVRFMSIAGQHTLLVVENGQGRALSYRARMTVGGRTRSTDVCIVLPHLPSYEHWPHPIERLELTDFRFIPWVPGRAPACR